MTEPSQLNWRVQGEHILFLNPSGATRNTRPATEQEIELWRVYKQELDKGQGDVAKIINQEETEATLRAQNTTLIGANEMYRQQLNRLADYLIQKWPDHFHPNNGAVDMAIELLDNYKIFKEAGATVPDPAVPASMEDLLQAPGTDAYAVPGSVGANPTERSGKTAREIRAERPSKKGSKK